MWIEGDDLMKRKILIISIIIVIITSVCIAVAIVKSKRTEVSTGEVNKEITSTELESIIGQNDINIAPTNVEAETNDKENEVTEEKELEEVKQETKEQITKDTEDKNIKETKEKNTSKITKEKSRTAEAEHTTTAVPTKNEEPAQQPQAVVEPEQTKPVEELKVETKKIDVSKYDYYENSLNGSYKGFIRDDAEMSKLKSLIDNSIAEFGYTNVKIVQDSSLARSGLRSFTANKTNVENAVYNSDGFTICYYAVKEYHISSDGTETLFQTRSYIKVK